MTDALGWTAIVVMGLFVGAICVAAFNDVFGNREEDED